MNKLLTILKLGIGISLFTSSLLLTKNSDALTFSEASDFGDGVGTEAIVPAGTTEVLGTNLDAEDGDLLRFAYDTATTVTINLDLLTEDANLLLFNGAGNPLIGDDDGGGDGNSQITFTFAPGEYLLGIGRNNLAGFDSEGVEIIDNDLGLCAGNPGCDSNDVLAFIGSQFGDIGGDASSYQLTFDTATTNVSNAVPFEFSPSFGLFSVAFLFALRQGLLP